MDSKQALANATMLAHPLPGTPIALTTNASHYAFGAVHEQLKYSTFDRKLLGLYLAVCHFRFLLEGRPFTAFVDHKPLAFTMSKIAEPWSAHQQRHLAYISEFTTGVQHIAGKSNIVADCLSRAVVNAVHLGIDYTHMASDQASDPEVQASMSLQLANVSFDCGGASLLKPSQRPVGARFAWHGLQKDVRDWVNTCVECQRARVHRHVKVPLETFEVPEKRFDHVNVDLVGLFPPSRGVTYLLTVVDRTTRWSVVVPLASKEDLQSSSAELVYGQPLCVPGDLPRSASLQRSTHLSRAEAFMPVPSSRHGLPQSQVPDNLHTADFVFIRPFHVLEPGDKTFVFDIRGKPDHVSVDRLKPTHQDLGRPVVLAQPPWWGRPPPRPGSLTEGSAPSPAPVRMCDPGSRPVCNAGFCKLWGNSKPLLPHFTLGQFVIRMGRGRGGSRRDTACRPEVERKSLIPLTFLSIAFVPHHGARLP
ncbi:hypothetical protein AAFF_G00033880 [Aldrovandia affinis]|uniref:Gypsy retrotransposon integrase-like protein 1 n=1 Tax=Aldrovandia affinis TaxID=143900 RepID=A0AAD7S412_9TELE|nr:hypothetical protein AAFF_G00033880 [Aldrovandia affinis]